MVCLVKKLHLRNIIYLEMLIFSYDTYYNRGRYLIDNAYLYRAEAGLSFMKT